MIGKILNDRYEILSNLGVGGMAYVYLAKDLLLKRKVAVKVLKNEFSDDEEFLKKFQMEAQLAASITHPNIVNVFDVGTQEIDGVVRNFIVMEYIQGSTLSDVIKREAPFDEKRIVKYSKRIASALRAAHEGGLIHRDIKPSNILLTNNDEIKVTDFGIARLVTGATMTYTTSILGTVHYISPEQAKGQKVGPKSDLYSLGVVMYEMSTGVVPFDADNSVGIALKHIQEKPVDIENINPNLNHGLIEIINNLLEKNPEDRLENANELLKVLDNYKSFDATYTNRNEMDDTVLIGNPERMERTNKYVSKDNDVEEIEEEKNENKSNKKWIIAGVLILILLAIGIHFTVQYLNQTSLEESMTLVPNFVNITEDEAFELAEESDLVVEVEKREYSEEVEKGIVMEQSLDKGEKVKKGTKVGIVVSDGKEMIEIPDLENYTLDQAREILNAKGLKYNASTTEASDDIEKDHVIRSIPQKGESIEKGALVTLVVSSGKEVEENYIPNLENRTLDEAIKIIQDDGFAVGDIGKEYSDSVLEDRVISQGISSGDKMPKGTKIDLVISLGPEPVEEEPPEDNKEPGGDENPGNENQFTLIIPIPSDIQGDTFNIKIFNASNNNELVFEKDYSSRKLAGGIVKVNVTADQNTNLEVHLNDQKTEFTTE